MPRLGPLVALLTILLAQPVQAQSLADAVEAAWQRSPEVRPLLAQQQTFTARRDAAARLFPPSPYLQGDATTDRFLSNQGFIRHFPDGRSIRPSRGERIGDLLAVATKKACGRDTGRA